MKRQLSAVLLALVCVATLGMAQVPAVAVIADVPFPFVVGTKSLPAGTYEFKATAGLEEITVMNKNGKDSAVASVLTRLSPRSDNESAVIFDVADKHYLSEVYVQGMDGFMIQGASGKHTHVSLKVKKQSR